MNLTPRENCTVEGEYQLSKICYMGGRPTLSQHSTATAGHNDSYTLLYKSTEYVQVLGIKRAAIFKDHCQSSLDSTRN